MSAILLVRLDGFGDGGGENGILLVGQFSLVISCRYVIMGSGKVRIGVLEIGFGQIEMCFRVQVPGALATNVS